MCLSGDVLTLLDIVCKTVDNICEKFGLDLGYYFSTPHQVMDLILRISRKEIGMITDRDQQLFVERSMRGGGVIHGDGILETDPTGQRTGDKLNVVFLDMNSLYPFAISHYSLPCGNKWLDNTFALNFPEIATFETNGPQEWFFEIDGGPSV